MMETRRDNTPDLSMNPTSIALEARGVGAIEPSSGTAKETRDSALDNPGLLRPEEGELAEFAELAIDRRVIFGFLICSIRLIRAGFTAGAFAGGAGAGAGGGGGGGGAAAPPEAEACPGSGAKEGGTGGGMFDPEKAGAIGGGGGEVDPFTTATFGTGGGAMEGAVLP
eukprot:TRINITY_DN7712_c0_g1_i1.p1 TRINITY_DN7712_c0_g1~~TRINITY_DN7712_c0_g1_i1.p1  ORF type:complete len:168 (+),score=38.86 TRINITY_DN7712_c0_g1_i1:204-707(+)